MYNLLKPKTKQPQPSSAQYFPERHGKPFGPNSNRVLVRTDFPFELFLKKSIELATFGLNPESLKKFLEFKNKRKVLAKVSSYSDHDLRQILFLELEDFVQKQLYRQRLGYKKESKTILKYNFFNYLIIIVELVLVVFCKQGLIPKDEIKHPVSACVYHIALQYFINYLGFAQSR